MARALGWGGPLICGQRLDRVDDSLYCKSPFWWGAFAVDLPASCGVGVTGVMSLCYSRRENKTKRDSFSLYFLGSA